MRNKKLVTLLGSVCLVIVLAMLPFLAACPAPAEEEPTLPEEEALPPPPEEEAPVFPKSLALGAGPVGGAYNMICMGLSKYWETELGIAVTASPGVARQNLVRFDAGRLDVMLSPSSWHFAAWQGMEEYGFPVPVRTLRLMCYLYGDFFYIVALKDSGMTKITDLKGKRVGCGPSAETWDRMLGDKLEANGIKYFEDPDIKKTFASYTDMCEMLSDGLLNACVVMVSGLHPEMATMKLMEEKELVALEWDPAVVKQFEGTAFPPGVIPKELLPFLEKDHQCFIGGVGGIIVHESLTDELVYELTKVLYKNLDKLAEEIPFLEYPAEYHDILTKNLGVPYHPGAIKYWKEVGIWTVPGAE